MSQAQAASEPRETGDILPLVAADGLIYDVDAETGEVISVRHPEPEFVIDSRERADWVLGKMMALDADIAAIDATDVVRQARAILANAEALKRDVQRRRDALEWRFGPELAQFARANLGKTKTWRGLYGSVGFRSTPARLKVVDEAAAAKWALSECPSAVRVTFDLALVPESVRDSIIPQVGYAGGGASLKFLVSQVPGGSVPPAGSGLEMSPEGETVTIRTGVES